MAKDDKTVSNEEAVNQDEQPGTPIESISLRDLDQIAQIIDLATQRGAFRGGELSTIGQLYDKLATFLNSVKEQQEAAKEAAEAEGVEVDDTDAVEAPEEK